MNHEKALELALVLASHEGGLEPRLVRIGMGVFHYINAEALDLLVASGVRGSDLWMLYKDICNQDYAELIKVILNDEIPTSISCVQDTYTKELDIKKQAFRDSIGDYLALMMQELENRYRNN